MGPDARRLEGDTAGSGWVNLRTRVGVVGMVALREATVTSNGWHLHLHVLFLTAGDTARLLDGLSRSGDTRLEAFRARLVDRWSTCAARQGLTTATAAQDVRALHGPGAAGAVADYFAKATYEVARSDLKSPRGDGLSPFGLLRLLVTGDLPDSVSPLVYAEAPALWAEWEQASRGRRQVAYSRGLRAMYGLGAEATDEDLAAEDVGGSPVVHLPGDVWRRDPGLPAPPPGPRPPRRRGRGRPRLGRRGRVRPARSLGSAVRGDPGVGPARDPLPLAAGRPAPEARRRRVSRSGVNAPLTPDRPVPRAGVRLPRGPGQGSIRVNGVRPAFDRGPPVKDT